MKLEISNRIPAEDAFSLSIKENDLISITSLLEEHYDKIREAAHRNLFSVVVSVSHLCENAKTILYGYLVRDGYELSGLSTPDETKLKISWVHKAIPTS